MKDEKKSGRGTKRRRELQAGDSETKWLVWEMRSLLMWLGNYYVEGNCSRKD